MPATIATATQLNAGSTLQAGVPQNQTRADGRAFAQFLLDMGDADAARASTPAEVPGSVLDQRAGCHPPTWRAPAREAPDAQAQRERSRERAREAADIAQRREPIGGAALHQDAGQLAAAELRMHQPSPEPRSSGEPEAPVIRDRPHAKEDSPGRGASVTSTPRDAEAKPDAAAPAPGAAQTQKPVEATPSAKDFAEAPAQARAVPAGSMTARAVTAPTGAETVGAVKADAKVVGNGPNGLSRAGVPAVAGPARAMNASAALQKLGGARPSVLVAESAGPMGAQIARGLAGALRQGGGVVTLRLTPEHLGQLKLDMRIEGSSVSATLTPSSEPARQLLEDSTGALKAALEARGLTVERIEVAPVRAGEPTVSSPEASDGRGLPGEGGAGGAGAEAHAGTSGSRGERTDAHAGEEHTPHEAWRIRPIAEIELESHTLRIRVDALA